jgi:ethanolamine ammonia-lyase small subunit
VVDSPAEPRQAPQRSVDSDALDDGGIPWSWLRGLTAARIGLQRSGASVATRPLLEFRLAHAQARDAVHVALDTDRMARDLADLGLPVLTVASAAPARRSYLMRPDLGRRLDAAAPALLRPLAGSYDLVIAMVDGLSARAVQRHGPPVLAALLPALRAEGWRLAPLVQALQGRVAIGDAIAAELGAGAVLVLIGERPGLTASDSLGAYLTWRPGPQTTDAERNCVSNVRPAGVSYQDAAITLAYLLHEMRARGLSGVALKQEATSMGELGSPGASRGKIHPE